MLPQSVSFNSLRNCSAGTSCPPPQKHFLTGCLELQQQHFWASRSPALLIPIAKDSVWRLLSSSVLTCTRHGPRTPRKPLTAWASESRPSNPHLLTHFRAAEAEAVARAWNAFTPLTNSLRFWCSDSFQSSYWLTGFSSAHARVRESLLQCPGSKHQAP